MYTLPGSFPDPAFQEQLDRAQEALAGGVLVGIGVGSEIFGLGELMLSNFNLVQAGFAVALGEVAISVGRRVLRREPVIADHH